MNLPNTFKELRDQFGTALSVKCTNRVDIFEGYPEEGMMLEIKGIRSHSHGNDVLVLNVSYTKFDEHNKQFETANYFDTNGKATLTAREKGEYHADDTIYVSGNDNPNDYFIAEVNPVWEKYLQTRKPDQTYLNWLKTQLERFLDQM